jgi:hypothetical protein
MSGELVADMVSCDTEGVYETIFNYSRYYNLPESFHVRKCWRNSHPRTPGYVGYLNESNTD